MLEIVSWPGFTTQGESVVTTNADEMTAETSRIGPLWRRYLAHRPSGPLGVTTVVYDRYESDHRGSYRVTLGDDDPAPAADTIAVTVHPANYARFVAEGEQPAALIATWMQIWSLTESGHLLRAFTADFERHVSPARAEIYVALRQLAQTP